MIEHLSTIASYCHICRMPKYVGVLKTVGWQYQLLICADCLNATAEKINAASPSGQIDKQIDKEFETMGKEEVL